jgi:hypothetical protein
LKLSSIALNSVHEAATAEDGPPGSEDRSATLDVVLSARFTIALVTALVTAFVTALTALLTALADELLITRKLPLARDTSANPVARDNDPSQTRHFLRPPAASTALNRDDPERTSCGRWVSIDRLPPVIALSRAL